MDGLYLFGLSLIQVLQAWSPELDAFMKGVTFLGTIEFYLLFIPLLYWCVDQAVGLRVLFLILITDSLATSCKQLLHQPRPYWLGSVQGLSEEPSYGIPSSHASNTLAALGLIAFMVKKAWLWILAIILILLIGLSRLYLGVHFPQDVLGGWFLGVITLFLFMANERRFLKWWTDKRTAIQIVLAFLFATILVLTGLLVLSLISDIPDSPQWAGYAGEARQINHYLTLGGFLFGAVTGVVLRQTHARFKTAGSLLLKIGRYLVGMAGLLALYLGLDVLFAYLAPDASLAGYVLRFIRYACVAFWGMFGAPWVFLKFKLAKSQ